MKVNEIMSSPVVAINPTDTIAHAKNLMLRHKIEHLMVIEHGKLAGILSMREIAKVLGESSSTWRGRTVDNIPVARVMKKKALTIAPNTNMNKAAGMMLKNKVGSLIVLDGEKLSGIITKTDLVKTFANRTNEKTKIENLMTRDPITAKREHSLARVVELMEQHSIGRVVIIDGEELIGMITEGDIALAQLERQGGGIKEHKIKYTRRLNRGDRPTARYVKHAAPMVEDAMCKNILTIEANEDATNAATIMIKNGIGGLPVVEGNRLVGIITKTDLTKEIARVGV